MHYDQLDTMKGEQEFYWFHSIVRKVTGFEERIWQDGIYGEGRIGLGKTKQIDTNLHQHEIVQRPRIGTLLLIQQQVTLILILRRPSRPAHFWLLVLNAFSFILGC